MYDYLLARAALTNSLNFNTVSSHHHRQFRQLYFHYKNTKNSTGNA